MVNKQEKKIVYKEEITKLLLFLLEIACYDVKNSKNFEEDYMKRLKFRKQTDWKKFRASIDLLDDTEYAMISFFKYQLGDVKNENNDFGELYLRLYGILNAVYLQINALKELSNLLNYPNRNKLSKKFESLDIYKLRGIAGAHTIDYMYDKDTLETQKDISKYTSFRIVQAHLGKTCNNIVAIDENNLLFEFNLLNCLIEYEKFATELLIDLINHSIVTLVHDKETKNELRERLHVLLPDLIEYKSIDENKNIKINKVIRGRG